METHNDRSNRQGENFSENQTTDGHTVANANRTAEERATPSRNQDEVDAQRGDNDDFTTNELDEANTMDNDDNPADARESGTR